MPTTPPEPYEDELLKLWESMFGDSQTARANQYVVSYKTFMALIKTHTERKILDVQQKQLEFLIGRVGTITLHGYGGEEKGEIKVISLEQLEKYLRDIESTKDRGETAQ